VLEKIGYDGYLGSRIYSPSTTTEEPQLGSRFSALSRRSSATEMDSIRPSDTGRVHECD
jgi:hypothetical protein